MLEIGPQYIRLKLYNKYQELRLSMMCNKNDSHVMVKNFPKSTKLVIMCS